MRNSLVALFQFFRSAPLRSALIFSIALHVLVAWSVVLISLYQPPASIVGNIEFIEPSSELAGSDRTNISGQENAKLTPMRSAGRPAARSVRSLSSPSTSGNHTNEQPGADVPVTGGLGDAVSDPGGISVGGSGSGGIGSPTKSGGGGGMSNGQGTPSSVGRSGQGGAAPTMTARPPVIPPIVIPPSISGSTASHEGAVYYEVDVYILFAPGMRFGVPVPGNEICHEGSRIRTIQPFETVEKKTDISKCHILEYGEDRREECLAGAHSVVKTSYHLTSPVNYSVNSCLVYDRSNCEWRDEGDGRDRQVCKAASPYDGIWAADTQFQYRCAKSESQAFSHSLHYQVRFLRDVEYQERSFSRRVLLRESRSILPCQ